MCNFFENKDLHPSAKFMGRLELGFSQPECSALTTTLWDTLLMYVYKLLLNILIFQYDEYHYTMKLTIYKLIFYYWDHVVSASIKFK